MEKPEVKTFYACITDWRHEFGETTVRFYDSIEKLKRCSPCVKECGIVEIKMEATMIQKPDYLRHDRISLLQKENL
jgi:hypothetical protein